MAIFGPKPWVNRFGKLSVIRLFKLLVFIAQKGVISFQNIVEDIFLAYIAYKKKFEKCPFLDRNHGLTPLEKCQFVDFFNILFLQRGKAFFPSRISLKIFSLPILPNKKKLEKWPFLDRNHGLTPFEICQFFDCLNMLFLQPRKAILRSRISKRTFSWTILTKKKSWKNGHFWTETMG